VTAEIRPYHFPARLDLLFVSGRSTALVKSKNPQHPAVNREAEEDWGKKNRR